MKNIAVVLVLLMSVFGLRGQEITGQWNGALKVQGMQLRIKVPWTLNSDEVWVRTHKMAGKLWFWGSLVGMALYFVVPKPEWVFVPLMIILVVVPIVYSYVIYQKLGK